MSQPVIAHGPVITLNVGILLRIARLNKVQADAPFLVSLSELGADEFGAVIAADRLRFTTPFNDLIQRKHKPNPNYADYA